MKIFGLPLVLFVLILFFDVGQSKKGSLQSCSDVKKHNPNAKSGVFSIDPDGEGEQPPFPVECDMSDKNGIGVTVIGHDSWKRTLVHGCEKAGCYSREVKYHTSNLAQLANLVDASTHCEQFIKYECYSAVILHHGYSWLESRDGSRMKYWGGASPGSNKCACGMTNSCASKSRFCNCDKNENKWREDSGLLTHKPDLPVSKLRFGDTGSNFEKGYYTLGKLKCYKIETCVGDPCLNGGSCKVGVYGYVCSCAVGFTGKRCELPDPLTSCSDYKSKNPNLPNGHYLIDPDGKGGQEPFTVLCDMRDKNGVGVTVISHDSEIRTLVRGCEGKGCLSRSVTYTGVSMDQLAKLTSVSTHCEQFIKYECYHALLLRMGSSWLESRDGSRMKYWGGSPPGSNKCACGMTNSCASKRRFCNCDKNDFTWREDSGLLTYKPDLPVSKLSFGDTGYKTEKGFYTLGKLKCYKRGACIGGPCLNGGTCKGGVDDGYVCSCVVGFFGKRCEADIDECKEKSTCDENADCKNTAGSYKCVCKEGYRMDGKICKNIDECSSGKHKCDKHAFCVDIKGSHKCKCKLGYEGDGAKCTDIDECSTGKHKCDKHAYCINTKGSYKCKCKYGYEGDGIKCTGPMKSCSAYKSRTPNLPNGHYLIDPDGEGDQVPFIVFCDMRDKNGVGVTVIGHDSEKRTRVHSCEGKGCSSRSVTYTGVSMDQLAHLKRVSTHCEQFIKYECYHALLLRRGSSWLEKRDGSRMKYWGGASPGSNKCACGMTNSCASKSRFCNCDKNDFKWRKDSGLLTYKPDLPVAKLRFGDTGHRKEKGFYTLGKLKCYRVEACVGNPCLNGGTCEGGVNDGYVCSCVVGFIGKRCESDIDECKEKSSCDENAECKNTAGSYNCVCKKGYRMDGKICKNINECSSGKKKCGKHASCIDTKGSYKCRCKPGYKRDGAKCTDIDECTSGKSNCDKNAVCTNLEGSYKCTCKLGYKADGAKCTGPVASCSAYKSITPNVPNGHYLIDPDGKGGQAPFMAFCDMRDKNGVGVTVIGHDSEKRTRVHGCERKGCFSRSVTYTGVSASQLAQLTSVSTHCEQFIKYECHSALLLRNGYSWLEKPDGSRMKYWGGASPDSNKCACGMTSSCALKSRFCNCDKNDKTWREDSGLLTYKPDLPVSKLRFGDTGSKKEKGFYTLGKLKCYKIEACIGDPCLNGGSCKGGVSDGYVCSCVVGFTGKRCEADIDECKEKSPCGKNAECKNTAGSYKCVCREGHRRDGDICKNINECSSKKNNCDKHAYCIDTKGSYKCKCIHGYEGDGAKCTDIDECKERSRCDENADCKNTAGSYNCVCKEGYRMDGKICKNIDECSSGKNKCHKHASCIDTKGSYKCKCIHGYEGDGVKCTDIDECNERSSCDENADCKNTAGSYNCVCKKGYRMDGKICENIDECSSGKHNCDKHASCIDMKGWYKCKCKPGYEGDGVKCTDIDECKEKSTCDENAECKNTAGSYKCVCKEGYRMDGKICKNIDECSSGKHKCDKHAYCINTKGSYKCKCKPGYEGDGVKCTDIDECKYMSPCDENAECKNTAGSYKCVCKEGYRMDGKICKNIDECSLGKHKCDKHAYCINTKGSYKCKCKPGYEGDGVKCTDIDECKYISPCGENAECRNTAGSYKCSCKEGYQVDGKVCKNIDECSSWKHKCDKHAYCIDTKGSYKCKCKHGYEGDGVKCTDIDECHERSSCDENADCKNTAGSYNCVCKKGYRMDGKICKNIDECSSWNNKCDEHAYCIDTKGSYKCKCKHGYEGDGAKCTDVDECKEKSRCDENAECRNTAGSYKCICEEGYQMDDKICKNIDECSSGKNKCHKHASCIDTKGSYKCKCKHGYEGDGVKCTDIDECKDKSTCHENADCKNTFGSYICICKEGYRMDGKICKNIDECSSWKHNCDRHASCIDTKGSYKCKCIHGYEGDGVKCTDMDECSSDNHKCDKNSVCMNTEGSYKCKCKSGYKVHEGMCTDIDECKKKSRCDENAVCKNTDGSYKCICKAGYHMRRHTCQNINECALGNHNCHKHATCIDTKGSYKCKCNLGYKQDGATCSDFNECSTKKHKCGKGSRCINTEGSYKCRCKKGYQLKGQKCIDIDECTTGIIKCAQNAVCTNTEGSHTCTCKPGYEADGMKCRAMACYPPCRSKEKCAQFKSGHKCVCKSGYVRKGDRGCVKGHEPNSSTRATFPPGAVTAWVLSVAGFLAVLA